MSESGFVRATENSINTLAVSGCGKAPPSRSGISELRNDDRAEHLLQSRLRHPVRPQDANGVHGPRRRADDIVHVYRNRHFVGERNAKYFQRRNARNAVRHRRRRIGQRRFWLSRKIISTVFDAFNVRLLALAHASMLAISLSRLSTLQAGITR